MITSLIATFDECEKGIYGMFLITWMLVGVVIAIPFGIAFAIPFYGRKLLTNLWIHNHERQRKATK